MTYYILESVFFFVPLALFFLVPDEVVPHPIWAVLAGVAFLVMTVVRSVRAHTFPDEAFATGMVGVMLTVFGLILFLDHQGYLPSLVISLGVALLAGVGWAFWKASHASH